MALESLRDGIFSSASDVWSYGVLMWELFNPSVRPYKSIGTEEIPVAVAAGKRLDIPENCPRKVARIIEACWITSPERRPSFLVIANLLCRYMHEATPSMMLKNKRQCFTL